MVREILKKYGLDAEDIDALMANFSGIRDIINSDPSKISSLTKLSIKDSINLQNFLKKEISKNSVGNDFLKRWGKVTSEQDLKSAYEEYTRLSKLYPKSPIVWETKGEILEKMGRFEEAKKSYEKAYILYLQRGEKPPKTLTEKIRKNSVTRSPHRKVGLSNGLGNINGFKNGIINGTGIVNGTSRGLKKPPSPNTWKVIISVFITFIIIAAPLLGFIFFEKHYAYAVDGNFQEWSRGISYYGLHEGKSSVNINYVKFHIGNEGIYFYIDLESKEAFKSPHGIYIFFDTDNSTNTGYLVEGIGADYLVELYGWNNTLKGKILYKFNSTDQNNYGGFKNIQSIAAILEKNQIEGFAPIKVKHFRAVVISYNYANQQDIAPCPYYGKNALIVEEYAQQKVIKIDTLQEILQLKFTGPEFTLHSITFRVFGTANMSGLGNFTLEINEKFLSDNYTIYGNFVNFTNLNTTIPKNSTISVWLSSSSKNMEKTVMLSIENFEVNIPYYIENVIIGADYIGEIPKTPEIDGSFLDWKNVETDSPNDVVSPENKSVSDPNIDILRYGDYISNSTPLLLYLQVQGKMLGGTDVPVIRAPLPPKNNNSLIINQTNVPHKKIYGMDTIDIFINSDNNRDTGFSPSNYKFGADYLVQIYGRDGKAYNASLYKYVNGNWSFVKQIKYAMGYHSIELNTFLNIKKGDVLIVTFNWKDYMDVGDKPLIINNTLSNRFSLNSFNFTLTHLNNTVQKDIKEKPLKVDYLGESTSLNTLFGVDVKISNLKNSNKRNEKHPSIVIASNGTLWVVWSFERRNGKHDIAIAKSTDNGETWEGWRLYQSRKYDTSNPIIVRNPINDELYVFFENHTSGAYFQFFKYTPSTGWNMYLFKDITWDDIYNISATVSIDGSGGLDIYLAFEYHNSSSNSSVAYMYSLDGGNTWDGIWLSTLQYWNGHPSIAISTGDQPRVFLSFDYYNSTDNQWHIIIANNTMIGNNTWDAIDYTGSGNIWSGYSDFKYPSIYASNNIIYVTFQAYKYTLLGIYGYWNIELIKSLDNGVTWSNPSSVTSSTNDEEYPYIVANGENVYIFYLNTTTGYVCLAESNDGGESWVTGILVSDQGSGVGIYRTISAIYSNGNLYVVWTDNRNNNQDDIYFDHTVPELNNMIIIPLVLITAIAFIRKRKAK